MTMLELLEESPIIAAVKSWEGLEKSLKSECKVVFVLFGTICDIDQIVARIKDAGKVAIVHVDMIQGLSTILSPTIRGRTVLSAQKIHWWNTRRRWDFMRSREPLLWIRSHSIR